MLFLIAVVALLVRLACAQSFVVDTSLAPYYPFVVHEPINGSPPPPLMFMLGGSGSRASPGEAAEFATYNGVGRDIKAYYAGQRSGSTIPAAESFLTVIPIAPNETLEEWRPEYFPAILDKVRQNYTFDDSRRYIAGSRSQPLS